jgi:CubicO group peptidase (beta-lactamase class C family)
MPTSVRLRASSMKPLLVGRLAATLVLTTLASMAVGQAQQPLQPVPDPQAALAPLALSMIDGSYCAGVVVALVSASSPPKIYGWGETVRGNGKLPDGNTIFEIGSVTKVFTSLLLAELVVDKQVTLDTSVAKLLPLNTKIPTGKRAMTLLDLATHTSGLPPIPDNLAPADRDNPYADYSVKELFAFLAGAQLTHEPGAAYEYSNLGVGLLGQALAHRGGTDWATLVATRITRPLGMTATMVTLTEDARARFAQGYDGDGEPVKPWDLPTLAGAGALRSTALDLATFVKAELAASRDSKTPLAKAMALTQRPYRNLAADPAAGQMGLAWLIKPGDLISHEGQTGGFHSYVALRRARQVGVVVLASGGTEIVDELGAAAMAAVSGEVVPTSLNLPGPDKVVDEKTLASYVGEYVLTPTFAITISRVGPKLFGTGTGQPRFRLHAHSQRDFAVRVVAASLTFELAADGKVTGLVLHQGGIDQHAARK